jgi:hypothetical protein
MMETDLKSNWIKLVLAMMGNPVPSLSCSLVLTQALLFIDGVESTAMSVKMTRLVKQAKV